MKIEILTHYPKSDPTFLYDWYSRDVLLDGSVVKRFSDAYHDGGRSALQFALGIAWVYGIDEQEIIQNQVADCDE